MGMVEGRATLRKSMKEMMMHWSETKSQWNDGNAHAFESKYLVPLESDAKQAINAMDQMSQILQRIKQECAPE
jgi:hypothetical protein